VGDVVRFLQAVVALWREGIRDASAQCFFYAWNDEMSGQLRFSLAPAASVEELPFACRLRQVTSEQVARAFLEGRDVIPFEELLPALHVFDDGPRDFVLDLWAEHL
jgi:hypothetical protein